MSVGRFALAVAAGIVAAGLLVYLIVPASRDDGPHRQCAMWLPVTAGKVTILQCMRWEEVTP